MMADQVKSSKDLATTTIVEEGLLPGKKPKPADKIVTIAGEHAPQPNQQQKEEHPDQEKRK